MRILVTGASGTLGAYVVREVCQRGIPVVAWSGTQTSSVLGVPLQRVDLSSQEEVVHAFRTAKPTVVLHLAALATVGACYQSPDRAQQVNTRATQWLAELAGEAQVRLVYASTDLVFDGEQGNYCEADAPKPTSVYGRSKWQAEPAVLASPGHVVVRLSLLVGRALQPDRPVFFDHQIQALRAQREIRCFFDEWRTPLDLLTAAQALLALAETQHTGIVHLGGPERLTRLEMGLRLARFLGVEERWVVSTSRAIASMQEPRPRDTSLDCSRWRQWFPQHPWPRYEEALKEMLAEHCG